MTRASARLCALMQAPAKNETLWLAFLRSLVKQGLNGVKLAINTVCNGASWQRCRVHVKRNL